MGDYTTGDLLGAMDCVLMDAGDGCPIRTNAIDRLPPFRARMVVKVALDAGATLEHGTREQFETAALNAARSNARQVGWWRKALGLPPRPDLDPEPRYVPPAGLPAGWSYAPSGESGTRTREGQ